MKIFKLSNNKKLRTKSLFIISGIMTALFLNGCSSDSNDDVVAVTLAPTVVFKFKLEVTNLTNAQPLSPVAFVAQLDAKLWEIGSMASIELETLAESGGNAGVLGLSDVLSSASSNGPIPPGATKTIEIAFDQLVEGRKLSGVTMLVNTNDAFAGFTDFDASQLTVGESKTLLVPAYDSGTESNSELMGTIPGPADMGEGFNSARDDVNFVSMHSGVVSQDDGLTSSVLTQAHRFDNPVAKMTITRTE
jgi:hypothetical protein